MRFNLKSRYRTLLLSAAFSLAGAACSSQQQQDADLELEQQAQMMQEQGEQNYEAQEVPQQNGETSYDGEESEEALSQDQNTYGEGEYDNNTATNETFNTANDDELESLMADDVESEENEIMADSENMTDEPLNNTVMADNNVAALDETTDSAYESETEESAPMAESSASWRWTPRNGLENELHRKAWRNTFCNRSKYLRRHEHVARNGNSYGDGKS